MAVLAKKIGVSPSKIVEKDKDEEMQQEIP